MYEGYPHEVRPFTDDAEYDAWQVKVDDLKERNKDSVADPTVYENLDYIMWSQESYNIGITLYDGKLDPFKIALFSI